MNSWTILFFGTVVLLFLLPLLPALAEWRFKRDAEPLRVVREYDGNIKHFAIRFRQFLGQQFSGLAAGGALASVPPLGKLSSGDAYQLVDAGGKPAFSPEESSRGSVGQLLLGTGALQLGDGMFFEKEVFAAKDLRAGNRNSFRAILAKGDIMLGDECDVLRWAHSDSAIVLGRRAKAYGRLSADSSIQLHQETRFGRMHAPVIRFGAAPLPLQAGGADPLPRTPLAFKDNVIDQSKGRWLVSGELHVPPASSHAGSLVSHAGMTIGAGSLVEGSVKSSGDMVLEANCRIDGSVVCTGNMHIGPGCIIKGPVVCERIVTIEAGTVVGTAAAQSTVTAAEVRVQEGVVAYGTVWARELGYVAPALEGTAN